jgi:hypothetical protein
MRVDDFLEGTREGPQGRQNGPCGGQPNGPEINPEPLTNPYSSYPHIPQITPIWTGFPHK